MATRRRRPRRPALRLLLWSQTDQVRFDDAVERLFAAIGDLRCLLTEEREWRSEAARRANRTRQARDGDLPIAPPPPH